MPTNLAINDDLLTVNAALGEYVARRKQRRVLALFGKIDYDPAFDYKRDRRAQR
jgi:hypothetical protein